MWRHAFMVLGGIAFAAVGIVRATEYAIGVYVTRKTRPSLNEVQWVKPPLPSRWETR